MTAKARYSDGKSSKQQDVYLKLFRQGVGIYGDADYMILLDRWAYPDIRVNHDWSDALGGSFEHKSRYGSILGCSNKVLFDRISRDLKTRDRATYIFSTRPVVLFSLLLIAIATVVMGLPAISYVMEQTAWLIPDSAARKIGNLSVEAMNEEFEPCEDPQATAYLQQIMDELVLASGDPDLRTQIHLYKTPVVNAFAMPDRHMGVLTGFLRNAKSEAEIAGVLAHELGHIAHKDPLKYLMQEQGLNMIAGLSSGGTSYGGVASMATTLSSLDYSRGKELAADAYAKEILEKTGYGTAGLSEFLARVEKDSPAILQKMQKDWSFLSTHPDTRERIRRLEQQQAVKRRNVLTKSEFRRLQSACSGALQKRKKAQKQTKSVESEI